MRRSICQTEPGLSYAGEVSTWKFLYTTPINLPKGTKIKFDLQSKGRKIDWETPTSGTKNPGICGIMPDEKTITAKALDSSDAIVPDFEFTLPSEIKAGETFTIKLKSRAQTIVQRRRPFLLYVDPKGKGDYKEPETFTLDIKGNKLTTIRIIAPSIVAKNKRFDVTLRFEDSFGNLTNNAEEGTLIEMSYEHLRENLNWKLFVPETGFLNLPNLYFNEPGVYRIQLQNLNNKNKFYSHPIKCFDQQDKGLFWGLFHGESERVDSGENIEGCLRHIRDEKSLHFFSSSPFESAEETPNEAWKNICSHIVEFNEDDRFTTFLGLQWFSEDVTEGLRTLVFAKDNKPILRKKDAKTSNLKKMYKGLMPKELISIPCFSMAKGLGYNFSEFSPEFERVVEIYNAWGSSECTTKEGNTRPIASTGKVGVSEWADGSIRKALNKGYRFGFVAGGLDDRSIFAEFYEGDQVQYSPGLTAILATEHTKDALFAALYNRNCYATTGERIIIGFFIAGSPMGSELSTKTKPGLCYNRHITGYVSGITGIQTIEFIRNGAVFHTISPKTTNPEFAFDDAQPASTLTLTSTLPDAPPFLYYYMKVTQEDGHIAWSSPIWIDLYDLPEAPQKSKKKR